MISFLHIPFFSFLLEYLVMDISDIRKANLLKLIEVKSSGSQKDFANAVPTAPAYISQIINGTIGGNGKPATVGTALARKIEKAFDLDHGYMDTPHNNVGLESNSTKSQLDNNVDLSQKLHLQGRRVPVISWVQAGSLTTTDIVIKDTEVEEWLPPNEDCGKNGYGLRVVGNSMSPNFLPGDRIYINPDIQTFDLQTNDLVIVSCFGESEATFKKLIIEGNNKYLQPLNPSWPDQIIKLTEDCKLVGRVVGLYRKI